MLFPQRLLNDDRLLSRPAGHCDVVVRLLTFGQIGSCLLSDVVLYFSAISGQSGPCGNKKQQPGVMSMFLEIWSECILYKWTLTLTCLLWYFSAISGHNGLCLVSAVCCGIIFQRSLNKLDDDSDVYTACCGIIFQRSLKKWTDTCNACCGIFQRSLDEMDISDACNACCGIFQRSLKKLTITQMSVLLAVVFFRDLWTT